MNQPAGAPALELAGIEAAYGRQVALRDVSVTVPRGSLVALIGANGAGKTTLLRVAAGLLGPRAGTVRIDGVDLTGAPPNARVRSGLSLIPEGRGIFRSLSVDDNLLLFTPPWVPSAQRAERLQQAFDAFPVLAERRSQIAGSLSGGQQQMLALARIYLTQPQVALLDEVSMGLAPIIVDEIFVALERLARHGIALLLVEQYINRALEMCDGVYLLDRGQVTFSGPPGELEERALLGSYLGADIAP